MLSVAEGDTSIVRDSSIGPERVRIAASDSSSITMTICNIHALLHLPVRQLLGRNARKTLETIRSWKCRTRGRDFLQRLTVRVTPCSTGQPSSCSRTGLPSLWLSSQRPASQSILDGLINAQCNEPLPSTVARPNRASLGAITDWPQDADGILLLTSYANRTVGKDSA